MNNRHPVPDPRKTIAGLSALAVDASARAKAASEVFAEAQARFFQMGEQTQTVSLRALEAQRDKTVMLYEAFLDLAQLHTTLMQELHKLDAYQRRLPPHRRGYA